ncbi:MAG: thiamine diphosphokinase [Fimbriimonadaceae bacterium]
MEKRILGVLAGNDTPERLLRFWATKADILIAADRGADLLLSAGHFAHTALGDFDSSDPEKLDRSTDIYKIDDQNFSDCDKLIHFVEQMGHHNLTIIGFEGDRLDHVLAGLGTFLRSPLNLRIVLRWGMATLIKGPTDRNVLSHVGQTVSLLPLLPTGLLFTRGLAWEIEGETLALGTHWSLSNRANAESFNVKFESGAVLVIQERDMETYEGW